MIKSFLCPALSCALEKLKDIVQANEREKKKTVIFCEDRLTLAAERTVCAAVGGTMTTSVYTFARFQNVERGKAENILSSQGSAMAIRRIIEENRDKLTLFGKFAPSASASAVYDTIAMLYSSKISADDVKKAALEGLLESKLQDVAFIYSEYEKYLKEHSKRDKNAYLSELSSVVEESKKIRESHVIFLGFQSFTRSSLECVKAVMRNAKGVSGLFIGGKEELYVNEAESAYIAAAEEFGGAVRGAVENTLIPEVDLLRRSIFDPESYYRGEAMNTGRVHIFEAEDEDDELEFIAASIKKFVLNGAERYAKISVMLPDVAGAERDIRRVFSEFRIPYFLDRRMNLSEHPVCSFIIGYLECAAGGCAFEDTNKVVSSPLFPATREEKDIYRNYALRLANFRGGVKREPREDILAGMKFDFNAVQSVRQKFLSGLALIPQKDSAPDICRGIRELLKEFEVEKTLSRSAEKFKDSYPAIAEFGARVYESVLTVLEEAEEIAGGTPLREFIKILKSGFVAYEISLIPPKADAVFIGDLSATANIGSDVVFAARLTGDVPRTSSDTALLTDREISLLERVNIDLSPKIRQVNLRRRELAALNICAFKNELYLSYPTRLADEESGVSEIITYALAVFRSAQGARLTPVTTSRVLKNLRSAPYYCSEPSAALKILAKTPVPEVASSVYEVLAERGYKKEADEIVTPPEKCRISSGQTLFTRYGSISPTTLESYFACPYKNFMQQGLKLKEREEGAMRPLDTGNFIHTVLQKIAPELNDLDSAGVKARAEEIARELMKSTQYASLSDSKRGEFIADNLIREAGEVSRGMYEQIVNSNFKVTKTETRCSVMLSGGLSVAGRIDRVDSCGDMVRIIDYKTGTAEASATKYYMGLKLQLPLYLLAASSGGRAAGAYYFPASVEYREKADGVFRLQGFMDGSAEVVSNSDINLAPKEKSEYFDAYLTGRKIDGAMEPEEFRDFLSYSTVVANTAAGEIMRGNITPSPTPEVCSYCKMGGSCGFAPNIDGAVRRTDTVKCSDVAGIVRKMKGEE